jgi:hypothetical protein
MSATKEATASAAVAGSATKQEAPSAAVGALSAAAAEKATKTAVGAPNAAATSCRVEKRRRAIADGTERRSKRSCNAVQRLIPMLTGQRHPSTPLCSLSPPKHFKEFFEVGEIIGEGSFGSVRLCQREKSHDYFAMKYVPSTTKGAVVSLNEDYASSSLNDIKNENAILQRVRGCEFVVQLVCSFISAQENAALFFEHAPLDLKVYCDCLFVCLLSMCDGWLYVGLNRT